MIKGHLISDSYFWVLDSDDAVSRAVTKPSKHRSATGSEKLQRIKNYERQVLKDNSKICQEANISRLLRSTLQSHSLPSSVESL